MKISDLMKEWRNDAQFDLVRIEEELARVPKLHEKYLNIMTEASLTSKALSKEFYVLRRDKKRYYSNDMDIEEIREKNWPKIDKLFLKSNIDDYLLADEELAKLQSKIEIQNEIAEYCKSVLKEVGSRTWQIRSLIDYRKYTAGI